jgi:hypothetical protein
MAQIGQDIGQVRLEHAGHLDHRAQLAAAGPAEPLLEKLPRAPFVGVVPELGEEFFASSRITVGRG